MDCPKCQPDNGESAMFCYQCRYELKKSIETPSEAYSKPKSYF